MKSFHLRAINLLQSYIGEVVPETFPPFPLKRRFLVANLITNLMFVPFLRMLA